MRKIHTPFFYWLSGNYGRSLRMAIGAVLVIAGWYNANNDFGIFSLVAGLLVTAAGLLNFSLLALAFHEPFFGYLIRNDDPMARF